MNADRTALEATYEKGLAWDAPGTGAASAREKWNADRMVLGATCEKGLAWDAPETGAASLAEGKGQRCRREGALAHDVDGCIIESR